MFTVSLLLVLIAGGVASLVSRSWEPLLGILGTLAAVATLTAIVYGLVTLAVRWHLP